MQSTKLVLGSCLWQGAVKSSWQNPCWSCSAANAETRSCGMEQLVHDTVNDLHKSDAQLQAAQACSCSV